jgi:hypothetical protein
MSDPTTADASTTKKEASPNQQPATKSLGVAIDEIVTTLTAVPEGLRLTAVRAACEGLGLNLGATSAAPNSSAAITLPHAADGSPARGELAGPQDIRSLRDAKQPKSNQEMACVMAYYLQYLAPVAERKTAVSAGDIEKYYAQAGFPLPKAPGQVLVDTKGAGYFDAVDRGTYKLNPVGHNLVVHGLPRKDGAATPSKAKKAASSRKKKSPKAR